MALIQIQLNRYLTKYLQLIHRYSKRKKILAEEAKRVKNTELSKLNEKFKSTFETLDDLPDETKSLLEKGVTLEQAYVATHYDQMTKPSAPADPVKLGTGSEGTRT